MKPRMITVKIANATVRVPEYINAAETQALADTVSQRIEAIQEDAERIDTQAFALRAAFEFAIEIEAVKQAAKTDEKDLVKALDALLSRLRKLATTYASPDASE